MSKTIWQPLASAPHDGTRVLLSDGETVWVAKWVDCSRTREQLVCVQGNRRTYETITVHDGWWQPEGEYYSQQAWAPLPLPLPNAVGTSEAKRSDSKDSA